MVETDSQKVKRYINPEKKEIETFREKGYGDS